tara:strand:- start:189 stop:932 length:744 start_codon:yes stop_codon:yes gene_type:complete
MLKFLFDVLVSPLSTSSSTSSISASLFLGTRTRLPSLLASCYLSPILFDSADMGGFGGKNQGHGTFGNVTTRSQVSSLAILTELLEKGCLEEFKNVSKYRDNGDISDGAAEGDNKTLFEVLLPKLVTLSSVVTVPDSFARKGGTRSAVYLLRLLAAHSLVDDRMSLSENVAESSRRQQRQKTAWTGPTGDFKIWIGKLLVDRESTIRACGYGICGDLLRLAWSRSSILSNGDSSSNDDDAEAPWSFR